MRKLLGLATLGLVVLAASAQWTSPAHNQPSGSTEDLPAYNSQPPTRPLPPILSGSQLTGPNFAHSYQVIAYQMAAKIPNVLFQQPCFCRCDREMGHNSLHSCFSGTHGAGCSTCMKEAIYAYQQTKRGRSPVQIRQGIERGEWMNVDYDNARL